MAKLSSHLPRFLRFGRSRSQKSTPADSSNAADASGPPPQLGTAQQAQGGPVPTNQNFTGDSAGQLNHESPPATSLVEPISTQALGPHNSVTPLRIHPPPPSLATDSSPSQHQGLSVGPPSLPATGSQQPPASRQPAPPLHQPLPHPQDENPDVRYVYNVHESRNVAVQGQGHHVTYTSTVVNSSNKFMTELLEKTIIGAAFDSSARDPPPRCHPETRLAILKRCLEFIDNCLRENETKKMRWVVGSAGVGKSAIMQNVADSSLSPESPGASIFFSINGRNDGTRAIITLAFQLAAKCEPYRVLIEYEITRNPSLLQSALSVQFKKFLIEPFIHHPQLSYLGRVLIIIDGLDECDKKQTQEELLRLISECCLTYPSSRIVWILASRPEDHITSFFAQAHVRAVYEKEDILVDSDESCADVKLFLRDELTKIQNKFSPGSRSQWPSEQDLRKLADAAGGLFAFADTVMRYIGDPEIGKPTSQLKDVLEAIDANPLPKLSPQEQQKHPLARLDVLYARILSKVPGIIMKDTRKILLGLILESRRGRSAPKGNFLVFCNWLGMSCEDAYAAIRHLCSVLEFPRRDKAYEAALRSFHKSFIDYIYDSTRSGFFSDIEQEARRLEVECTFRILEQAPDGIDVDEMVDHTECTVHGLGVLERGPGTGGNISLTWSVDEENEWNDNRTRLDMYKLAVSTVVEGIRKGESAFSTEFCIRLVTTRLHFYDLDGFPLRELRDVVFRRTRHDELMKHGILKQVPVKMLNFSSITRNTELRFRRPTAARKSLPDPWGTSCTHDRTGDWSEGQNEDWTTEFGVTGSISVKCRSCSQRLKRQLEDCKTRSPDYLVTILLTSAGTCLVEFQFVDPDDKVSEWIYSLVYFITEKERGKLGSPV